MKKIIKILIIIIFAVLLTIINVSIVNVVSADSFGSERYEIQDISLFWNLFNKYSNWQLEAQHPFSNKWLKEWNDINFNSWLDITRTRFDDNLKEKINLTVTNKHPNLALKFRFTFVIDLKVRNFINESSTKWNYIIDYDNYQVFFNFSDLKPLVKSEKIKIKHGINNINGTDVFWFRIISNKPLTSGKSFSIDPVFGNEGEGGSSDTIENYIKGIKATSGDNGGEADSISAYLGLVTNTFSVKCALYEYIDDDTDFAGILIAETEEKEVPIGLSWTTFNFNEPKPTITPNTDYYLLAWSEDKGGACYLRYGVSDFRIWSADSYNGFPSPLVGEAKVNNMYSSLYCTYTETGNEGDPINNPCDWSYGYKIIIDHDFVDDPLNNFPILISFDSDISSLCQENGEDIRFLDSTLTKEFYYEIELWDVSGNSFLWVNITDISASIDTDFYMYYGNPDCESNENPNGVWNNDFVAVWHMDALPTATQNDSTANHNDAIFVNLGTDNTLNTKIGRCIEYNNGGDYYRTAIDSSMAINKGYYVSYFIYIDSFKNYEEWWSKECDLWCLSRNTNIFNFYSEVGTKSFSTTSSYSSTTWYYQGFSYVDTSDIDIFMNGYEVGSSGTMTTIPDNEDDRFSIGHGCVASGREPEGRMDEVRIHKSTRSDSWIETDYFSVTQEAGFLTWDVYIPICDEDEVECNCYTRNESDDLFLGANLDFSTGVLGIIVTFTFFGFAVNHAKENPILSGVLSAFASMISIAVGISYLGFNIYSTEWWVGISFFLFGVFCSFLSLYYFSEARK